MPSIQDNRKQLISWDEYEENLPESCEQLGLPRLGPEFVRKMQREKRCLF